jgi:hypothetical protein
MVLLFQLDFWWPIVQPHSLIGAHREAMMGKRQQRDANEIPPKQIVSLARQTIGRSLRPRKQEWVTPH